MTPLGLYEPGDSPIHRAPAGGKFLGLLVFAALLLVLRTPLALASCAVVVVVGYLLARVSAARCWRIVRVTVPVLAFVFGVQWWLLDGNRATEICLRLLAALGAANLLTLTTRVDDLISAVEHGLRPVERPLRRSGLRPERIGLLVGLTLQAVAVLSSIVTETRDAQRARGASRSVRAFAVPFLVRVLRHADELGEALAARGADDEN